MSYIPVVRLEVEGMKASILAAFTERIGAMDADIQQAVEAYCTPSNLKAVIERETARVLDVVIREEVDRFYRYGAGRRAVAEAVKAAIAA